MVLLAAATGLSIFMTQPWQLFLTWGLLVGIGSGAGAVGIAGRCRIGRQMDRSGNTRFGNRLTKRPTRVNSRLKEPLISKEKHVNSGRWRALRALQHFYEFLRALSHK